jgi:hypothetical protein
MRFTRNKRKNDELLKIVAFTLAFLMAIWGPSVIKKEWADETFSLRKYAKLANWSLVILFLWVLILPDIIRALVTDYKDSEEPPFIADRTWASIADPEREILAGDLRESFPRWVETHGLRKAKRIYLRNLLSLALHAGAKLLTDAAKKLVGR